MKSPNETLIFGIGAQKAGTTWLHEQLERLDGCFLPRPKELHYWDCIRSPYFDNFRLDSYRRRYPSRPQDLRGRLKAVLSSHHRENHLEAERYRMLFDSISSHEAYRDYLKLNQGAARLIGDITPSYALLGRETFEEMLAIHSDVRFVMIFRDPVDRLWSGIRQRFRRELRNAKVTSAWLESQFKSALRDSLNPDRLRSDYRRTINELEAVVPAHRIHYTFFESLFSKDRSAVSDLERFLELPPLSLDNSEKVHSSTPSDPPSIELLNAATEALSDISAFMVDRFGSHVPKDWHCVKNADQ